MSEVRVSRCIAVPEGAKVQLIGFCDSSIKGYAALAYLRMVFSSWISIYYLVGKTKLALIKSETIPRLELCAVVLLARWLARFKAILMSRFKIDEVFAWTDLSVVLSCLTTTQVSFKVFVTHRVGQIHSLVLDCVWRYAPSQQKATDCSSHGLFPSQIVSHSLY